MSARFKGVVGIAAAADASSLVAPVHYLQCGNANIEGTPNVAYRDSVATPDAAGADPYGHALTFSVTGIETPVEHFGYLWWLALGLDTFGGGSHVLTPTTEQKYLCLQIMRNSAVDLGSSDPTEVGLGGKIASIKTTFTRGGFAKTDISGPIASIGTPQSALTQAIPTGADEAPLSWKALQHASGDFQIGYDGAAVASDGEIQGFMLEYTRELDDESYRDLDSDQPSQILEGRRGVSLEVVKRFRGNAAAGYSAWLNQEAVEIDANGVIGTHDFQIEIPTSEVSGPYSGEIATSAESVDAKLSAVAHRGDMADVLLRLTTTDAEVGAYT